MKSRLLGSRGFEVSEVGLGCWQLGADWGDRVDEDTAFAILQAAVDNGVTLFDTADVYGAGLSESLIGRFFEQSAVAKPRIITKFGRGGDVYPDGYSRDRLRAGLEGSLERLKVDRLDLVQLHCIPTEVLRHGEIFDWLREMQAEGLIAHFGASVETVEEGLIAMEQEGLLSLQVIFNIFRQKLVTELFPRAQETGTGIIVRLPLASGLLSGKFTQDTRFNDTDHRNFNADGQLFNVGETFAGVPFAKGVELVDALKADLPTNLPAGTSMGDVAMRWILDHPAISTVIPGASRADQVARNAAASDLAPLSDDLHAQMRTFYRDQVAAHVRGAY